jgi:NhaA family Na+:H+ antiporter
LLCAAAALAWANSGAGNSYFAVRDFPLPAHLTSRLFVNDALMALFFLLVGLEIKRELLTGEISSAKRAALPLAGALGGMLIPAALYLALNHGGPAASGWGIPMATDIAFALAVLTLLGNRIPVGLKIFLVALAILDDLGAILVIALFYTDSVHAGPLFAALGVLAATFWMNVRGVRHPLPYLLAGALLWFLVFTSGVHATLAGVALAFCIPHGHRLESALQPWVTFGILPLFALLNAGVLLSPALAHGLAEPLGLGILLGLCLGKPAGILLFSWLAVRLRRAELPAGVSWTLMTGAGLLGGIGFTMSLFIAGLGLPSPALRDSATFAVLTASALSGAAGYILLSLQSRRRQA